MAAPLQYIKRPSSLKKNAPLLIMCHGYGSDENDLFSFASEMPKELFIISLKAPYPLEPSGNAWYAISFDTEKGKWSNDDEAKASTQKIAEFIDYACAVYPVNSSNITLLGFSQGCILSHAVALNYPNKVQNIIGLSGYINEAIVPKIIDASKLDHLHVFSSHGTDDQVIPVAWARRIPEFYKPINKHFTYKEYPAGHGITPQNFQDFVSFLKKRVFY